MGVRVTGARECQVLAGLGPARGRPVGPVFTRYQRARGLAAGIGFDSGGGQRLSPRAQQAPYDHELAHVVRVVVRGEEQLAQVRLPVAVGDGREEVGLGR